MLAMGFLTQMLSGLYSKRSGQSLNALTILFKYREFEKSERIFFNLVIASVVVELMIFFLILALLLKN